MEVEIILYIAGVLLTYTMVIVPWWKLQQRKVQQDFEDAYHIFKLRMVRRHYPDYHHLSFAELEEEFDIDASFQNIGTLVH